MQLDINKLELPRDRVSLIKQQRCLYDTNVDFYKRIDDLCKSTLKMCTESSTIEFMVREYWLLGEFLFVPKVRGIVNPEVFTVLMMPDEHQRRFSLRGHLMGNRYKASFVESEVLYLSRKISKYDVRGTPAILNDKFIPISVPKSMTESEEIEMLAAKMDEIAKFVFLQKLDRLNYLNILPVEPQWVG